MGKIVGAYLMPHPPIIIREIGKGEQTKAQSTVDSMVAVAHEIENKKPDTIVLISPHGPIFSDAIGIMNMPKLKGNFTRFGSPDLSYTFKQDGELIGKIIIEAQKMGVLAVGLDGSMCSSYRLSKDLDWGVLVPLHFVNQRYTDYKLVAMGISHLPVHKLYTFGLAIKKAVESHNGDIVIIASGDLSHRLKEDGPYGYHPAGEKLDNLITTLLGKGDVLGLLGIDPSLAEEGAECGLRSIIMALGTLDGQSFNSEIHSYEGPFGVGYCVASMEPGKPDESQSYIGSLYENTNKLLKEIRDNEDEYVRLARQSLEEYILYGTTFDSWDTLPEAMIKEQAGTFVTIKLDGRLRGCIGTIEPTRKNIAQEIIHNAISAGSKDPRFLPVREEELSNLVYSVDILKAPEAIESINQLDVKRYGVIVRKDTKTGLLLPNLDGVNTPAEQVQIALEKAGINKGEPYTMERFEVIRHH
ncbi:MAG: AmmeMemoRadiSam system protein A [Clostridiales bacterium]|nr:AmmeMemoRadiSam system protein A [Clostridiales bacterium]